MYAELKRRFGDAALPSKTKLAAIEHAYADMSRRQMGHNAAMKNACIPWLQHEVFIDGLSFASREDFNLWHRTMCEEMGKRNPFYTVGRAQKVLNMAFKYLACVDDSYAHILPYCHMTLDKYTLAWCKRIGATNKVMEWSNITDYAEYAAIQTAIRKHLGTAPDYTIPVGDENSRTIPLPAAPFEAEFIVWEGEKVNEHFALLCKSLREYAAVGREQHRWLIGTAMDTFLRQYKV